jgi:hypothetical protein
MIVTLFSDASDVPETQNKGSRKPTSQEDIGEGDQRQTGITPLKVY